MNEIGRDSRAYESYERDMHMLHVFKGFHASSGSRRSQIMSI